MAHLQPVAVQEEIEETATEDAAPAAAMEEEAVLEAIPLPPPPEDAGALLYRIGQLEAQLQHLAAQQASSAHVTTEQEAELSRLHSEVEIQEEELAALEEAKEDEDEDEDCSLWEKMMGGHPQRRSQSKEE